MLGYIYHRYEIRKQHPAVVKFMFLHSKIKVPNKKRMVWNEEYTLEYKP